MKFSANQLLLQGAREYKIGNVEKAEQLYLSVLETEPKHPDANYSLGLLAIGNGKPELSLPYFKIALEADPKQTRYWLSMIESLIEAGQFDNARGLLRQSLEFGLKGEKIEQLVKQLKPKGFEIGSLTFSRRALKKHLDGLVALHNQGQFEEVIKQSRELVVNYSKTRELYNILGAAHTGLGRYDEAIKSYSHALRIDPSYALAHNNLGNVFQENGAFIAAIESYQRAINLRPDYAEGYSNLGAAFQQKGELDLALENYHRAIQLKPESAEAHHNLGNVLQEKGDLTEAIASYEHALKLKPGFTRLLGKKIYQQSQICDWAAIKKDQGLIPSLGISTGFLPPLSMLSLEDHPERHLQRSKLYVRTKFRPLPLLKVRPAIQNPKRLRIGYVSESFRDHPVMRLMLNMFKFHDRRNFEIHAFSYSHAQFDKFHHHLVKGFDALHDVPELSDQEIAEFIRSKGIDIVIDLTGFTQHCRPNILAYRAAPIQVSYLGYPSSMGIEAIDYIIADRILIPNENRKFYSEKVVFMPHCYQVSDNQRVIPKTNLTRADMGLPESNFVFCCFNKNFKITPNEFDIWMRLLIKVEGSVLWLARSNHWSEVNLKKEAQARGVDTTRLIFAGRSEYPEYLARLTRADLCLDTFNFNAGAIANDALWCGLPIVTKQGQSYTARMASSLLNAAGLPELITTNEADYEKVALDLATSPQKLKSIKIKLTINKKNMPLFDTERFTRNIETAYKQMYEKYYAGEKLEHLFIKERKMH